MGPERDKRTILVVEDELNNLKILTDILLLEKYVVIAASSLAEAQAKIDEASLLDLILLDLNLPDGSGLSLVEPVRKKFSTIAITLITAVATPENTEIALQHGVDKVISKPFKVDQLIQEIRTLLLKSPQHEVSS